MKIHSHGMFFSIKGGNFTVEGAREQRHLREAIVEKIHLVSCFLFVLMNVILDGKKRKKEGFA